MERDLNNAEFLNEDDHGYTKLEAWNDLQDIHEVYRDSLNALIDSCIKQRVLISRVDLEVAMQGMEDALADVADHPRELLPNYSSRPEGYKRLLEDAYNRLLDSFRIRSVDYANMLSEVLRPFPANPATKGDLI